MATREKLPQNDEMDERREIVRQTIIEYLRDKTASDERKEIIKAAIKEVVGETAKEFGFMSMRLIAMAVAGALIYFWLNWAGWVHK